METNPMTATVAIALLTLAPFGTRQQAHNPEPLAGPEALAHVEGVRLVLLGMGGYVFDVRDTVEDPYTRLLGLRREQLDELAGLIKSDAESALRAADIPLYPSVDATNRDVPVPMLWLECSWSRSGADTVVVDTTLSLRQASPPRADGKADWTATWRRESRESVNSSEFASRLRSIAAAALAEFIRQYKLAHATAG